jgi:hypothetical protein
VDPGSTNRFAIDECAHGTFATGAHRNPSFVPVTKAAVWDSIIVGSSPLLLIEAIYLGRTGRKVLVLEENGQLGGAWGRLETKEFPYLDIGCHYFDISKRAYEFLRFKIGLDLVPFRPQPQFAYRNILFPYDYRQVIRVARNLKTAYKRRSLTPFVSNVFRDENYRLRMFPFTKTFLYPQGGSHELITRLTTHAQENNVTILKPMRVDSIRFNFKRKQVQVSAGGASFEGNEVVAGSQAQIADALHITPKPDGTLRCVFPHVNLVVRDRSAPTFSYIRFLRHHAVIRMTDITDHMRHWNEGLTDHRVICIAIRDTYDKKLDDPEKVEQLFALLKKYRFVDPSAKCERSYWSRYPAEFLSDETQKMLQRDFSPMIRLFPTTNFSVGIVSNLSRWEQAFVPQPDPHEVFQSIEE